MTVVLAQLFVTGLVLSGTQRFLLMLPICLSIAVVYKTLRCNGLREVVTSSLVLWVSIVAGMYAVGVGLWVLYSIMV